MSFAFAVVEQATPFLLKPKTHYEAAVVNPKQNSKDTELPRLGIETIERAFKSNFWTTVSKKTYCAMLKPWIS